MASTKVQGRPRRGSVASPLHADLADVRFRALLDGTGWAALPPAVRHRFSKRVGPGQVIIYKGRVTEVSANPAGRLLAQVLRLVGGPLPRVYQPGAAVVTVTEDQVGQGQVWTRCYMRPDGFPQTLHSAKRFTGLTGLEEHLGFGIAMALTVAATPDGLSFTSDHYVWRWGPIALRLPRWLEPGRLVIEHRDLGHSAREQGQFAFHLDLRHPLLGHLMHQVAIFEDPPA